MLSIPAEKADTGVALKLRPASRPESHRLKTKPRQAAPEEEQLGLTSGLHVHTCALTHTHT